MRRILLIALVLILSSMLWGWFNIWRSPAYFELGDPCGEDSAILTMAQYGELMNTHERPYLVERENLAVYGATHTKDPADPQIARIDEAWKALDPTVALVEGRLGFLVPYAMDPIELFGESGHVAQLAKRKGAEIYSWELPRDQLILAMLGDFPAEQVALQQILTPYFSNYRFGPPSDPDAFVAAYLHRAQYPGLDGVISSVQDVDRIWQHDFPDAPDWRETSDEHGLPGYLGTLADRANLIRNQHLLCVIKELRGRGERVFVVCGSSHAVCLDPAIGPVARMRSRS